METKCGTTLVWLRMVGNWLFLGLGQNHPGGQVCPECSMAHLSPGLAPKLAVFKSKVFSYFVTNCVRTRTFQRSAFQSEGMIHFLLGISGILKTWWEILCRFGRSLGRGTRVILNSPLYLGASPDFRCKVAVIPSSIPPAPPQKKVWPEGPKDNGSLVP